MIGNTETASAKVILGSDHFDEFHCIFRSFPSTRVSWTLEEQPIGENNTRFNNITRSQEDMNVMMPNASDMYDYSWTIDGGLFITNVMYANSGVYNCSGTNGYNTTGRVRRLRVRS